MQLNPAEISELLKSKIQSLDIAADTRNQGSVVTVTDGICRIHGLSHVMQGEMIEFPGNTFGLALNLERDSVGAVVLGEYEHIREGDVVKATGKILSVPVGPELIGRVVNSLGQPIDGKGPIDAKMTDVIEKVAPGVIARKSVSQPVQTGLKSIDSMVPIGRGQRELIIGAIGKHLSGEARNFVQVLAQNRRLGVAGQIRASFEALRREHEGTMEATVVSALPVEDAQLKSLVSALEQKYGRRITAKVELDPKLIGGLKILVGDKVIDATVRGKLDAMAAALTH